MPYNIGTEENPQEVWVTAGGGMVDAIVRATDYDTFIAAAKAVGLMYELTETVVDEVTGESTEQGTGEWVNAAGVFFDHLGPVVITAGTYDEAGNELTPPVMDTRHHVNIRLASPATERTNPDGSIRWHGWALEWTQNGTDDPNVNAEEQAKVMMNVALINPDTIKTPARVWL